MSRAEQVIFLREHLFELPLDRYRPLGDPTRFLHALVTLISRARDEDVEPAEYLVAAAELAERAAAAPDDPALGEEAAQQAELAGLYAAYEKLMRANDRFDFGDQVSLALRLLREHPAVLAEERQRYRYILVDEFQDTNHAQFELVKLLAGSSTANVTVVGDDDQSIYRFRGAALSNILGFRAAFPRAGSVVLNDNFRSRQPILDAAYRLIRHNDPDRLEAREGLDKRLVARSRFDRPTGDGGPIELLAFDTGSDEADAAGRADRRLPPRRPQPGDHAILVRTNRDADPILRALNMARIPWRFSGTAGLYHQPEVRLLVSFLRAVNDPEDSVSCYDLATSEIFGLDPQDVTVALNAASRRRTALEQSLRQARRRARSLASVSGPCRSIERLLASLDQHRQLSTERNAGELLYHFVTSSGWLGRLAREAREGGEERLANVARFFEIVRRQAGLLRDDRLPFLVAQLDTLIEAGDDPSTADVGSRSRRRGPRPDLPQGQGPRVPDRAHGRPGRRSVPDPLARRPADAAGDAGPGADAGGRPPPGRGAPPVLRGHDPRPRGAAPELGARLRRRAPRDGRASSCWRRWTCRPPRRSSRCGPAWRSGWRGNQRAQTPPAAPARPPSLADRRCASATGRSATTSTARRAIGTPTSSACRPRPRTRWSTAARCTPRCRPSTAGRWPA